MRRAAWIMAACAPACAWAQAWEDLGPAPVGWFGGSAGRVSAVACSSTDPDLYYVGAADGGVWKTTDGGQTWACVTPFMPTSAIGALAIDPNDDAVVYAGTGEANYANHSRYGLGVYKTIDGGATWSHLARETFAGRTFAKLAIDPVNTQTLYAAVGRAGGFPELAAAKGHPGRAGPVGVFKSVDAAVTWDHLTSGVPAVEASDVAVHPSDPSIVFAAIGRIFGDPGNGVYRSKDGGMTWQKLTIGLPASDVGRVSLAIAPSDPMKVYALFTRTSTTSGGSATNIGGFRSINGGDSWSAYGSVNQATYGWYLNVAAVHPTDSDMVFYGGLDMSRTKFGSTSTVTPLHVDIHAITFDAAGRLLSGDDGGLHRSTDLGSNWIGLNEGLGTIQFYAGMSTHPTNPDIAFGGFQDNGSGRRNSTTKQWDTVNGGDGGWTQLDRTSPNIVFVESQGTGALRRSTNGGNSFNSAGNGLSGRNCFLPPYVFDPSNPQRLLYGTHRVYVSTNGGTQWSPLSDDITKGEGAIRALAIAPSDAKYVYAATNDGNVAVSKDGGATFTIVLTDNPGWPRTTRELWVDPVDPETVYLAGAAFGVDQVRRSTNAGMTWESLDGNLPDIPVNVVAIDRRGAVHFLYAGTDAGVYRSSDDGATWRRYGVGMPNAVVVDIRLEPERNQIYVATQGRGAWRATLSFKDCPADCDANGMHDLFDFLCFTNAFAAGDPWADLDWSGSLDLFDFLTFNNLFVQGCP